MVVEAHDDVAGLEPRARGRAAGDHRGDLGAAADRDVATPAAGVSMPSMPSQQSCTTPSISRSSATL
jgi:hypothetical protein